jgi:hypothetical protein
VSKTILLIGNTSSGKTHFGAQLLSRLTARNGLLKMRDHEAPSNVGVFETVLQRLGQGLSSDHTESTFYGEVLLPAIGESGQRVDLVWPDYAGEQMTGDEGIARGRTVPAHWMNRINGSDHWILMVRPLSAATAEDLLNRPLRVEPELNTEDKAPPASPQLDLVELLQILRHVKKVSSQDPTESPRMLVLLSCWDELPAGSSAPAGVLAEHLPALNAFLQANWAADCLLVYGLSALGKSLSATTVDPAYRDLGPESFGFVVLPSGARVGDLTLPIEKLAQ